MAGQLERRCSVAFRTSSYFCPEASSSYHALSSWPSRAGFGTVASRKRLHRVKRSNHPFAGQGEDSCHAGEMWLQGGCGLKLFWEQADEQMLNPSLFCGNRTGIACSCIYLLYVYNTVHYIFTALFLITMLLLFITMQEYIYIFICCSILCQP